MIDQIWSLDQSRGRARSRLPVFTPDQINYIKGSADFLGLNYYTSAVVEQTDTPVAAYPSFDLDMGLRVFADPDWPQALSEWLYSVPEGIRSILG